MTSEELQKILADALAPVHSALGALRVDIDELGASLAVLDGKVDRGFDRMDHRLALVESRMEDLGSHYAVQARSLQRLEAEVTDVIRLARPVKAPG